MTSTTMWSMPLRFGDGRPDVVAARARGSRAMPAAATAPAAPAPLSNSRLEMVTTGPPPSAPEEIGHRTHLRRPRDVRARRPARAAPAPGHLRDRRLRGAHVAVREPVAHDRGARGASVGTPPASRGSVRAHRPEPRPAAGPDRCGAAETVRPSRLMPGPRPCKTKRPFPHLRQENPDL